MISLTWLALHLKCAIRQGSYTVHMASRVIEKSLAFLVSFTSSHGFVLWYDRRIATISCFSFLSTWCTSKPIHYILKLAKQDFKRCSIWCQQKWFSRIFSTKVSWEGLESKDFTLIFVIHHLLYRRMIMGADGLFNIWSLVQTQFWTGNSEANAWTISNSSL